MLQRGKLMKSQIARVLVLALLAFVLATPLLAMPANATYRQRSIQAVASADVLRIAWLSDVDTLDPSLAYDSRSIEVLTQVYDTVVTQDAQTLDVRPELATAWQVSADGKTYTFNIRKPVSFHEGQTLQASDVAYSIQRGLLQSDPSSPQWTLIEPIMGYQSGDITQEIAGGMYAGDPQALIANANPAELLATCAKVKERVTADDASGKVTIRLERPFGPFLSVLASYGYALDKEWTVAKGDWNGDCATWQHFYAPLQANGSKLATVVNGTGPFRLLSWHPEQSLTFHRHLSYWQAAPAVGRPLNRVEVWIVEDSATISQLLLGGEADLADTFGLESGFQGTILLAHDLGADGGPVLKSPAGVLNVYSNIPSLVAEDVFFVFDIADGGPRNYIGSGQLDGNGIPSNFFADIHVRRAFTYAFDFDAYGQFVGGTIRRSGPIPKPLMGYDANQPILNYNPALALQELSQAWGGQVTAQGFRMTIAYAEGNSTRRKVAELIQSGIQALDTDFHIDLISLPWSDYLQDYRSGSMPVIISGWAADYAHPHNFVEPYLYGTFATRQRLPSDLISTYRAKSESCQQWVANSARPCYEELQEQAYQDAIDIFLRQSTVTAFARKEVQGYQGALNHWADVEWIMLWKSGQPALADLQPNAAGQVETDSATGMALTLDFPAGAVTEPRKAIVVPDVAVPGRATPGLALGKLAFSITAFNSAGQPLSGVAFAQPVRVTVAYERADIAPLIESTLTLLRWNGSSWVEVPLRRSLPSTQAGTLQVTIHQTGTYALAGDTHDISLPVISRN